MSSEANETTVEDDGCVEFDDSDLATIHFHVFWVEGVALCAMAAAGLCANALSIVILNK